MPSFDDAPERPLAMDDFAVISYTGKLDDKPLLDLVPESKNLAESIPSSGSGCETKVSCQNSPSNCVGMNKGETRTIEIEFPADFPQTDPRRKERPSTRVELKEIKVKKAPSHRRRVRAGSGQDEPGLS